LAKRGQLAPLLPLCQWALQQEPPLRPSDCRLPTQVISALSSRGSTCRQALHLYRDMRKHKIQPDLVCYNAVISAAGAYCCRRQCSTGCMQSLHLTTHGINNPPDEYCRCSGPQRWSGIQTHPCLRCIALRFFTGRCFTRDVLPYPTGLVGRITDQNHGQRC
jgi:pentatricopeptide repeat protein